MSRPEVWKEFFETYYRNEINKLAYKISEGIWDSRSLYVDFKDLMRFKEGRLAEELLENPDTVLLHANEGLEMVDNIYDVRLIGCKARFYNLPSSRRILIRDLRSSHISKFVSIEGIVRKVTEVRPRVTKAVFVCRGCGRKVEVFQDDFTLKQPNECRFCKSKKFIFIPEESESTDSQRVRIQEYPENLRGGEQPQTIDVMLEGDLAGEVNPGDRVVINGIVRARPKGHASSRILAHMDLYIEGNSVEVLQQEYEEFEITEEDKKKILELSRDPEIYEKIVKSIAPAIYGYEDIKLAIALQLFGGVPKKLPDGTEIRGDIHILLVGDPGVAKSQLLRYVHKIAPRSVYTTGKGTTTAGLTATAVRDEVDGRWTLEAGALVLADKGIALVDEIDKMRKEDRSALHEALEQQSYHKDTEIMLADGRKVKIGEFVDKLMEANKDKVIYGKDTEILPVDGIYVLAYDPNAKKIIPIKADRVSRHKAPERFIRIKFSNGREITVTPEHPILIWDNGIKTIEAERVKKGMLVPSVRFYETHATSEVSEDLARFMGFILSEGFCYKNEKNCYYEIGFTDEKIVEEYKNTLNRLNVGYGVSVTIRDGCKPLITVRTISKDFYTRLEQTFPEAFPNGDERPARYKRIPAMIMSASKDAKIAFLNAFFKGDGFVDNCGVGFLTSSKAMAEDLQDLLLMLGVNSYIYEYDAEGKKYYKVVITGTESIERFSEIIKDDPRYERVVEILRMSLNERNYDILPEEIAEELRLILNALHINDGKITTNLRRNYNIHRLTVKSYLDKAKETLRKIAENLNSIESALKVVTIKELSKELNIPYSTLRYRIKRDKELMNKIIEKARKRIEEIKRKIDEIESIVNGNIAFLRIKDVEIIENTDSEWVYDITVEPYHLFVSHGLILHNTVSIAKAGINAILRARCALLAAANPKHGRFNRYESLVDQIDLSPTLLSRFDLIFIMTDEPDEERDEKLARHILDIHEFGERLKQFEINPANLSIIKAKEEKIKPAIDPELLRKYIAYAKKTVFPVLTKEAKDKIVEFYKSLRNMSVKDGERKSIPITARQLEALIRLAEASARVRLSNEVTVEDAERAISIFKKSLEQIAIDPETGELDIDYAFTGTSATQRDRIAIVKRIIEELENAHEKGAPEDEIFRMAEEKGISREKVEEILMKLRQKGEIYMPKYGYYRVVRYD